MRTEARRNMEAYQLNPTDDLPNIPENLHTIGAACDRWLERRGLSTNVRSWWSAQSRGGKVAVEREPAPPKPPRPPRQKILRTREEKAAIKRAEYLRSKARLTEEQKRKRSESQKRWREANREKMAEYSRKYHADKLAAMTPEQQVAHLRMLNERRKMYYRKAKDANQPSV